MLCSHVFQKWCKNLYQCTVSHEQMERLLSPTLQSGIHSHLACLQSNAYVVDGLLRRLVDRDARFWTSFEFNKRGQDAVPKSASANRGSNFHRSVNRRTMLNTGHLTSMGSTSKNALSLMVGSDECLLDVRINKPSQYFHSIAGACTHSLA